MWELEWKTKPITQGIKIVTLKTFFCFQSLLQTKIYYFLLLLCCVSVTLITFYTRIKEIWWKERTSVCMVWSLWGNPGWLGVERCQLCLQDTSRTAGIVDSIPRWNLSLSGPIQSDHLSIPDQMIPPSGREHSHGKADPGLIGIMSVENLFIYCTCYANQCFWLIFR